MKKSALNILMFWRWRWLQSLAKWAYKKVILKFMKELTRGEQKFIAERIRHYKANPTNGDGYDTIRQINKDFRERYSESQIITSVLNAGITTLFSLLEQDEDV